MRFTNVKKLSFTFPDYLIPVTYAMGMRAARKELLESTVSTSANDIATRRQLLDEVRATPYGIYKPESPTEINFKAVHEKIRKWVRGFCTGIP